MTGKGVSKIGIWVQGRERLGAAYEGIWRVIKQFLVSSAGSGTSFCFVAPARFKDEIEEFLSDLSDGVRKNVEIYAFGDLSDSHDDREAERQAAEANQISVDAWVIPNPMWAASKHLIRPKLVWFHDFLLVEFPQSYPRKLFLEFQVNIRDLSDAGAFFVFTSPYVKEKHGHEFCGIPVSQSTLILNPPIDGTPLLKGIPDDPRDAADLIRSELKAKLQDWCSPAHAELFYHHISSYPFESVPYLWVSSQNREHKGFLRLAQAHAALLRQRYLPYSMFTTALVDVAGSSPLEKFLRAELLLGDFMSVGKVSDPIHALFYKFARMTVHPSTFEGNLPLPFAESVSLGTPCIIPYSRAYADYLDPKLHPWIFYNPTLPGIVQKIEEVDQHRAAFVEAQGEALAQLRKHSLTNYFNLHEKAFALAQRHRPRSAEYVIEARESAQPARRRGGLGRFFAHPLEAVLHPQAGTPTVHARLWEPFALVAAARGGSEDSPLHWATYLGGSHPKGESYFLLGVDQPGDTGMFAEVGTWVDGEYQVADSKTFQFGSLDGLPADLLEAFEQVGLEDSLGRASQIGWAKLSWSRGVVPEVRIGGSGIQTGAKAEARLACLTRRRAPSIIDRS